MSALVRATIPGWQAFRTTIMIPEALDVLADRAGDGEGQPVTGRLEHESAFRREGFQNQLGGTEATEQRPHAVILEQSIRVFD